jgi:hypothetical protein
MPSASFTAISRGRREGERYADQHERCGEDCHHPKDCRTDAHQHAPEIAVQHRLTTHCCTNQREKQNTDRKDDQVDQDEREQRLRNTGDGHHRVHTAGRQRTRRKPRNNKPRHHIHQRQRLSQVCLTEFRQQRTHLNLCVAVCIRRCACQPGQKTIEAIEKWCK